MESRGPAGRGGDARSLFSRRCRWGIGLDWIGLGLGGGVVDQRHDGRADRRGKAGSTIDRPQRRHH